MLTVSVPQRWRRRWMLDRLIVHLKQDSLTQMGLWVARKRKACAKRLQNATLILQTKNIDVKELWREWSDQTTVQTAKLTSKCAMLPIVVVQS
jgi:hypothetical protein